MKKRIAHKTSIKAGLPPGSLVHIGERMAEAVKIIVYEYSESEYEEIVIDKLEDIASPKLKSAMRWIRVEGIHNVDVLSEIGRIFALHPLTIEDILDTTHRPKIEDFEDYSFILAKALYESNGNIINEQLSIIVRPSLVISLHETGSDLFVPLTNRLRAGKGRIRQMKADYLVYALLDTLVDNYFVVLEEMGETIESVEEQIAVSSRENSIKPIQEIRKNLIQMRRAAWPLRDLLNDLAIGNIPFVGESIRIYYKDVHDHAIQAADTTEIYRETLTELLTIYLTATSNRLNEVMKVLTIITTIFMPLTVIAGIYGMNFEHMPELKWQFGYPAVLLLMLAIALLMLFFFRKKRWM